MPCNNALIYNLSRYQNRDFVKFPVFFPVSREIASRDGFACDCVRHHAFPDNWRLSQGFRNSAICRAYIDPRGTIRESLKARIAGSR